MDLPCIVVNGFERVRSTDAARAFGVETDPTANWGAEIAPRMRAQGYEGPKVMSFGDSVGRGYERPRRISPNEFLAQHSHREDAVGELARAGLEQSGADLFAIAVAALASKGPPPGS